MVVFAAYSLFTLHTSYSTHTHASMEKPLSEVIDNGPYKGVREHVLDLAVGVPSFFASHELDYLSNRFPYSGRDLAIASVYWAKRIGHRDDMARLCKRHGNPEDRAEFALLMGSYRKEMKATIDSAEGAVAWAERFPEDRDEMRGLVGGGEWAFQWAQRVGDEEEMKSRISTTYWKVQFEREIEENESASFVSR